MSGKTKPAGTLETRRAGRGLHRIGGSVTPLCTRPQDILSALHDGLRADAERLHALGVRPLHEFLVEAVTACPALRARIGAYAKLDPAVLRALDGDRFPPPTIRLVSP